MILLFLYYLLLYILTFVTCQVLVIRDGIGRTWLPDLVVYIGSILHDKKHIITSHSGERFDKIDYTEAILIYSGFWLLGLFDTNN